MGRTYTSLCYHAVWSTKYRRNTIRTDFREQLYQHIGGIIHNKDGSLLEIGGIADHVHLLLAVPPKISVSDMLRFIKSNSSAWVNETVHPQMKFAWQPGFGAFTVSYSRQPNVRGYIQNQENHHGAITFRDEFLGFLAKHKITYDKKYVFEQEIYG